MLDELKLLNEPPVTVTSSSAKLVVASLEVKVNDNVESLLVSPSLTSAAVMVIVGGDTSADVSFSYTLAMPLLVLDPIATRVPSSERDTE